MGTQTKNISSDVEKSPPIPDIFQRNLQSATFSLKDTHLVSLGDRMTYTFAYDSEVGSIHFDRSRGEIFYKGHNIRNMDIENWQIQVLEQLRQVLSRQLEGKRFVMAYGKALDKALQEKRNHVS